MNHLQDNASIPRVFLRQLRPRQLLSVWLLDDGHFFLVLHVRWRLIFSVLRPLARSRLFVLCFCPKPSQVDACETVDLEFPSVLVWIALKRYGLFWSLKKIVVKICVLPSALPSQGQPIMSEGKWRGRVGGGQRPCPSSWGLDALRLWPQRMAALHLARFLEAGILDFLCIQYLWLCVPQALNCRLCLKICGTGSQIIISVLHQALSVNKAFMLLAWLTASYLILETLCVLDVITHIRNPRLGEVGCIFQVIQL